MYYDRNETKLRILKTAQRLFEEKGYDNTTIEDIARESNGMTKGAVYYYFESKKDILDNILASDTARDVTKFGNGDTTFERVKNYILESLDVKNISPAVEEPQIAKKNPEIIGRYYLQLNSLKDVLSKELIREMKDGTLYTEYPEEIVEFLLVYIGICMGLNIKDITKEKYLQKIDFVKKICDQLKFPIIDEEVLEKAEELYDEVHHKEVDSLVD